VLLQAQVESCQFRPLRCPFLFSAPLRDFSVLDASFGLIRASFSGVFNFRLVHLFLASVPLHAAHWVWFCHPRPCGTGHGFFNCVREDLGLSAIRCGRASPASTKRSAPVSAIRSLWFLYNRSSFWPFYFFFFFLFSPLVAAPPL